MTRESKRFDGRVALITGGAQGLGRAISERLAAEGAHVIVADVNLIEGERTVEFIRARGGTCAFESVDITSSGAVDSLVSNIVAARGRLDILVNNAGIIRDNRIENIADADWDSVLAVSLGGAFRCARAAFPVMKSQNFGRIVSFASMSWHGNFGQANYVAAKAGVVGLTRALALEGARHGITSNAISPGLIDTPMLASMNAAAREKLIGKIPIGRIGDPRAIAGAVAYLSAPETDYVTGVVLDVDGGISIGSSIR